jgi:predicted transcriptional regulator of viral defense system
MIDFSKIDYKSKRLTISKSDIVDIFNAFDVKIFKYTEISKILEKYRAFLRLNSRISTNKFIAFLIYDVKNLKPYEFNFPFRNEVRFVWGKLPIQEVLLSIYSNSYFSHYSAMFFNDLTLQNPKNYYINVEQKPIKSYGNTLTQSGINLAFKNKPRITTNSIQIENVNVHMLNGKFTNCLGVIERTLEDGTRIKHTNIERTLIDVTVRPFYSGGVYEVINAFKKAVDKVSINKLAAYLKELNYIYPYHQAIGFYLEHSGVYKSNQIDLLKKFNFEYDFYLINQMKETEYSKEWKLFYPKGF